MEIQAITPRIDNTIPKTPTQTQQNQRLNEEQNETLDKSRAPIDNDEQNLDLSGNALHLSESFHSRDAQNVNTASAITEPVQAKEIVRQTADLIKQFPSESLAVQSNLTSNVVKGLLG